MWADCAYDAFINRKGIVDLCMLGYPNAVHSDMLYWAKEENILLCARQLLNILFSVPQISVILADSTEEQRSLLEYYIGYWTKNRQLIMHGKFIPEFPEQNYARITAASDSHAITVQYFPFKANSC